MTFRFFENTITLKVLECKNVEAFNEYFMSITHDLWAYSTFYSRVITFWNCLDKKLVETASLRS